MKVRLVYIVGFVTQVPDQMKETKVCVAGMVAKYEARGIPVQVVWISNTDAMKSLQKNKQKLHPSVKGLDEFLPFRGVDVTDYSHFSDGNRGVGLYFVFHGRANSADINIGPVVRFTTWLMDKHPGWQLRKVVFLVCEYAGSQSSRNQSLLDKFANNLFETNKQRAQDLPRLAAWTGYITVEDNGRKVAASPNDRSNYYYAGVMAQECKRIYVYESGKYVPYRLSGPDDPRWHDPEVYTSQQFTVLLGGDSAMEASLKNEIQ